MPEPFDPIRGGDLERMRRSSAAYRAATWRESGHTASVVKTGRPSRDQRQTRMFGVRAACACASRSGTHVVGGSSDELMGCSMPTSAISGAQRLAKPWGAIDVRFRSCFLVALTVPVTACATQQVHGTAGAPASVTATASQGSGPPVSTASSLAVMHPLTCFPSSPIGSVGGVPDTQQDQAAALPVSSAAPVIVSVQLPSEPANVSLASVSVDLTAHQPPRDAAAASTITAPPAPPTVVKSIALGTPIAGSTSHVRLDGTSNTAGVAPPAGLYDVDVVQQVTMASSCVSNTLGGPTSGVQVSTTIGYVRLP